MSEAVKRSARTAVLAFWLIITIVPIAGVIASIAFPVSFYSTRDDFQEFARTFGVWAPVAFMVLQAIQVIITPISHYSVGYMGGFLFGPLWGTVYNYVGRLIGHVSAYILARTIAVPLAKRFVPQKTIAKYEKIVSTRSDMLLVIYFLPFFPDDELSYLAGLSRMRFRSFFLANLFGQIGGSMGMAYLGAGINTKDPLFWILMGVTIAGFPLLWYMGRRERHKQPVNEVKNAV
jgi:uncharacterized membrane protein YdjX (TVP38/TMEM64 family)